MRLIEDWEKGIFYDRSHIKRKAETFENELINYIKIQTLYLGYGMPSMEQISALTGLSLSTVSRVFSALARQSYLRKENGKNAIVIDPLHPNFGHPENTDTSYFDNFCIRKGTITYELNKLFVNTYRKYDQATLSCSNNQIYEPLIVTSCEYINNSRNGKYSYHNVFYLHDYQALVRAVGQVISALPGAVIIPDTASTIIRDALEASPLTLIALPFGDSTYQIRQLEAQCKQQQIAAIYFTPYRTYFTPGEVRHMIRLQKQYQFKLIIDDRHRPWFYQNDHLVLDPWAEIIDAIIGIEPLSYLTEELSRFNLLIADKDLIRQVRLAALKHGPQAYSDRAFAAEYVLKNKVFRIANVMAKENINQLKALVNRVLYKDNFWERQPARLRTTPVIYLQPKKHLFPPSIYEQLKKEGFHMLDPEIYQPGFTELKILRIELGNFIGVKNKEAQIIKFFERVKKLALEYTATRRVKGKQKNKMSMTS
jgi:hypothetical protein